MLRRNNMIVTAALVAVCALPGTAVAQQDLRSPDAEDAAAHRGLYEKDSGSYTLNRDYGSPDAADAAHGAGSATDSGSYTLNRDYGSPDAVDAARDLPPAQITVQAQPGPYSDAQRAVVESPEVQQELQRISSTLNPVVEVSKSSGGFDWGDAGIGAAGMLGLFGITAGFALLLTARRRRHGIEVAH